MEGSAGGSGTLWDQFLRHQPHSLGESGPARFFAGAASGGEGAFEKTEIDLRAHSIAFVPERGPGEGVFFFRRRSFFGSVFGQGNRAAEPVKPRASGRIRAGCRCVVGRVSGREDGSPERRRGGKVPAPKGVAVGAAAPARPRSDFSRSDLDQTRSDPDHAVLCPA